MKTFPLSLSGKARKWWMNEGDGKINTCEELVNEFFSKFYLLSCASNYDKMCEDDEEGLDPLEFITWRNSKFKNHKKADETTKHTLLYSWIEVGNNEGLMDEDISSDDDKDQSNSSMITKPEIKIGDEFLKILTLLMAWTKLTLPTALQNGDTEKWLSSEGTTTTWKKLDLAIRKIDDMVYSVKECVEHRTSISKASSTHFVKELNIGESSRSNISGESFVYYIYFPFLL
ncbi:hypothetical protein Tco_0583068 [Tanacetum coccineum]